MEKYAITELGLWSTYVSEIADLRPGDGLFLMKLFNLFIYSFILFQTTEVHRHIHNTYIYRKRNTYRQTERKRQNTLTKHAVPVRYHYHRLTACWQNLL